MQFPMITVAILTVALALATACERRPATGPEREAAPEGHTETGFLIEGVNGYTWRTGGLHRFAALQFDTEGAVVATYAADEVPAATALQRIDGDGATLFPGLIDAHGHLLDLGLARNRVDLVGTRSLDEALGRVRDYAAAHPEAAWILGRGWNQVLWNGQQFPRAADLDALGIDRPIRLGRIDGHAAWVNTLALQRAGIGADTADPHGGRIMRDDKGNARGILIDAAMSLVDAAIPPPTGAQLQAALVTAMTELASLGVTSAHDAGIDNSLAAIYKRLAASNRMPVRVYAMLSEDAYGDFGTPLLDDGSGFLAIRSVKAYLDGALGSRGAALLAPYSDDPGNSGLLFKQREQFEALARDVSARGFQLAVHAIGDAANRVALDGFAALDNRQRLRHRVEHAQIIALSDIERFEKLGVIASMQPVHATSDMNMAQLRVGADRIAGGYAWRKLLDSGARLASGSDFPVEPANPFFGLHAAVTRQDRDDQPAGGWYVDEAMTLAEALRTFTYDAAYAAHQESSIGTLEPGKRADFILLDRDPFEIDPAGIWQTTVLETWVDGKQVYTHH